MAYSPACECAHSWPLPLHGLPPAVLSLESGACRCPTQLCMTWRLCPRAQAANAAAKRLVDAAGAAPPTKRLWASAAPPAVHVDYLCEEIECARAHCLRPGSQNIVVMRAVVLCMQALTQAGQKSFVAAAVTIDAPLKWSALAVGEQRLFMVCWPRLTCSAADSAADMLCCQKLSLLSLAASGACELKGCRQSMSAAKRAAEHGRRGQHSRNSRRSSTASADHLIGAPVVTAAATTNLSSLVQRLHAHAARIR
jgi:hypothetical protein